MRCFGGCTSKYFCGSIALVSHKFLTLFVQGHRAYMVCGTTYSWTDAIAYQQLATTLKDAVNNC